MRRARRDDWLALRRRIHLVLDNPLAGDWQSRVVHWGLVALVIASVAAVVLESVDDLERRHHALFSTLEAIAVVVFTAEYALRLWSAPDNPLYSEKPAGRARWLYARSPGALIDLLAILPFLVAPLLPSDFQVLLLLRLARFFKLARYSPGMRSLAAALKAERTALMASAVILFGLVVVTAAAMHVAERGAQPDKFGSIPESMWWAIVTLTTVGYGDVVPVTAPGRILAGFTTLLGLVMLALPIGIVATAFAEEIHKREFVVTWGMIARVPVFAALDAGAIAEIMRYLRADTVGAGMTVLRRGDEAGGIFFIATGEVELDAGDDRRTLRAGDCFGGMASESVGMATVRTVAPTRLLVLDAADLRLLMEKNAEIGRRIEAAIGRRSVAV